MWNQIFIPRTAWSQRQTGPKLKPATLQKPRLRMTLITQLSSVFTFWHFLIFSRWDFCFHSCSWGATTHHTVVPDINPKQKKPWVSELKAGFMHVTGNKNPSFNTLKVRWGFIIGLGFRLDQDTINRHKRWTITSRDTWASSHECFMIHGLRLRMTSKLMLG